MPLRQAFAILALFCGSQITEASEIKTSYSITSTAATVTTTIKNATIDHEKLMHDYPFEKLAKALQAFPMVSGVTYNAKSATEEVNSSPSEYHEYKRSYPAFIQLNLGTPVTLMVRVEEQYRRCKTDGEKAGNPPPSEYDRHGYESAGSSCLLWSAAKIKGPYSIYGSFASSVDLEQLLREKQTISFDIRRDYSDKTMVRVEGKFSVDSELFDRHLFKFLDAVNVKVEAVEGAYSRSNVLLGTARILRVNNERVVGL
jgi:hypothetical protein